MAQTNSAVLDSIVKDLEALGVVQPRSDAQQWTQQPPQQFASTQTSGGGGQTVSPEFDPNDPSTWEQGSSGGGGGTSGAGGSSGGLGAQQDPDTGLWYYVDETTGKKIIFGSADQQQLNGRGKVETGGSYQSPDDQFQIYGENDVRGSSGNQLPYTPTYSSANSPEGKTVVGGAYTRLITGQGSAADVQTLVDAGVPLSTIDSIIKQGGGPGGDTASAQRNAATNAAAQAEQARHNRAAEVQNSMDAISQRLQAVQQARLAATKYAVTPSMAASGYFPALGPTSPLVRSGLAEPLSFQRVPFDASAGLNIDDAQLQRDLAMIRGQ